MKLTCVFACLFSTVAAVALFRAAAAAGSQLATIGFAIAGASAATSALIFGRGAREICRLERGRK